MDQYLKGGTKGDLPVDYSKIVTKEKIKKWKYLRESFEQISQSDDEKVELLIGVNSPRALEPVQVTASRDGEPYATKTVLRWCI